jgi:hypothetical protein
MCARRFPHNRRATLTFSLKARTCFQMARFRSSTCGALCWAQNRSSQETTSKLLRDDCCGREERPAFTLRFRTRPSLCTNWQSRSCKRPGPPASKSTGRDLPRPGRGPDHDQDKPYFEAGRVDRAVQKMRAAVQKNDRCLGRLSNAETTA